MEVNTAIQKLSSMIFDNSLEQPRSIEDLRNELRRTESQVKAMKTVVSMVQQNYDMGVLHGDILKIIDTTNADLKILCNAYLKSTCADRPACQIMCTHTFLKDFNDRNWMIQRLAINDAVQLSDEIIVKNYSRDIRRMCTHERKEVRMIAARCTSLFYIKNREVFFNDDLMKHLRQLLNDKEDAVVISALKAISVIESKENVISLTDVCPIIDHFIEKRNYQGIRAVLGVIKYKNIINQTKNMLLRLLSSEDVCVFYLSAMKLLENDESLYQLVYDTSKSFMSIRPEQQYNLLVYIRSFIGRVKCNGRDFVILNGDPDYIKDAKIEIFLKIYDDFSKSEIDRLVRRNERHLRIFELALEYNIVISDFFKYENHKNKDQVCRLIYKSPQYSNLLDCNSAIPAKDAIQSNIMAPAGWDLIIGEYLASMKSEPKNTRVYIELCGRFCRSIPSLIFKMGSEHNSKYLLKFYCLMMNRKIISEHQCLNYLTDLKKAFPHMPRIKLVMQNIGSIWADDIYRGTDILAMSDTTEIRVDFPINKNYNEVLCDRSLEPNKYNRQQLNKIKEIGHISHESLNIYTTKGKPENPHSRSMQEIGYTSESDALIDRNNVVVEDLPIFIDTKTLKGTLDILDSKMVLTIDILEESQVAEYKLRPSDDEQLETGGMLPREGEHIQNAVNGGFEHSTELVVEGRYILFDIKEAYLNSTFKFKIENTVFEIKLDIYKMIRPLRCDIKTFETFFSMQTGSIEVEAFKTNNAFEVQDNCFACKVFDQKVFAKKLDNFTVLKGDEAIIKNFK